MTDFRDAHKEDSSPPLPSLASPYLTGRCRPLGLVYSQPNQGFRGEFRGWMHLGLKRNPIETAIIASGALISIGAAAEPKL